MRSNRGIALTWIPPSKPWLKLAGTWDRSTRKPAKADWQPTLCFAKQDTTNEMSRRITVAALMAWLLVAVYYFYQYALRSAPIVMMPQLSEAFGVNALGIASIVGLFYYGYSPFSLVAGTAIDRFGAKQVIPIGAALVGIGALLFGTGNVAAANIGRFLQGAGGVFALVGAVYLVTKNFPASLAASFIGATQR